MGEIWQGFLKAIELIITLDPEFVEIAGRSVMISATSSFLASIICIPLGSFIHFYNFSGKRVVINIIQTLFSVPTVIIGLFVYVMLSRAGPLGALEWIFTPAAMIAGQVLLISPIMLGLTISALSGVNDVLRDTARSLGANDFQAIMMILREARYAVVSAFVMGFGRAISEVGCALMVGGNISGFTRVITTTISLETSKGELELAIALGITLLCIALIINIALNRIQQR